MIRLHLAAALVLLAGPALSQVTDETFCDMTHQRVADMVEGGWFLNQNQGVAMGGTVPVPLSPVGPDMVQLEPLPGGRFEMRLPNAPERMVLEPASGGLDLPDNLPGFVIGNGEPVDVEDLAGCDFAAMPRYAGQMSFDLGGQGAMQMALVVHFVNRVWGFGVLQFQGNIVAEGGPVSFGAMRTVQFSRPY